MQQPTSQLAYSVRIFIYGIFRGLGRLQYRDWISLFVLSLLVIVFSKFIYGRHDQSQRMIERQPMEFTAESLVRLAELGMDQRLLAMDRMAARHFDANAEARKIWNVDAKNYIQDMPGISSIQWIDKKNNVRWEYPEGVIEELMDLPSLTNENQRHAQMVALKSGRGSLTAPITYRNGEKGFLSYHATFSDKHEHTGFIVGIYKSSEYFSSLAKNNFDVHITMDGEELFRSPSSMVENQAISTHGSEIRGRVFHMEVSPNGAWKAASGKAPASNQYMLNVLIFASSAFVLILLFLMSAYRNMKVVLTEKQAFQRELLKNFDRVASSEQLLHKAQQIAKIGNWDFSVLDQKITWSDQMYEIFPEKPMSGEPSFEKHKASIHPDDRSMWQTVVAKCIKDGKPYVMHFRTIHGEGKEIWVEARGEGRRNEKGEVTHLYGTCQDITEKKKMEETVQYQERMAHRQARLASLGQLAAGVGHEINNPLTIISGYLDIIENRVLDRIPDDEKMVSLFGKMKLAIFRIRQITQGLRNFARKEEDEKKHLNLKNEIEKTLLVTEEIFEKEGFRVNVHMHKNPKVFFQGITGQLQQVLLNLMVNAKDAMQDSPEKRIDIRVICSGQLARVQVEDSGDGIPANLQDKIFEPFFTTKDVNEGTGLGLSLSQKIMRDHDGDLVLMRSDENGSVFEMSFPVFEKSDAGENQEDSEDLAYGKKVDFKRKSTEKPLFNMLIVDDELEILSLLETILEGLPLKIDKASNGLEALKKLSEKKYDILLTDLKMAEMDGETLLGHLKDSGMISDLRIFVMTGGVDQRIENDFKYRDDVEGYFLKPFEKDIFSCFDEICKKAPKKKSDKKAS